VHPTAETISRLLGLLYEAAASPGCWPEFLDAVRRTTNSDKAYFVLADPQHHCDFSLQLGFDPFWQAAYLEYYHQYDLLYEGCVKARQKHGEWTGTISSVVPIETYKSSLIYNEFVKPQANGNWDWCCVAVGGSEVEVDGGLAIQRTTAQKQFDAETVELLAILSPHVHRAFATHRTLGQLRAQNAEMRQSVEAIGLAVISVAADGRLLQASAAARAIIDCRDGLEVDRGFLRASLPEDEARLARCIAGAAATGCGRGSEAAVKLDTSVSPQAARSPLWSPGSGGALLISRRSPKRPLRVVITPFYSSQILVREKPSALVFVSDPDGKPFSRAAILRELYGLTPTESRIADLLAEGREIPEVADRIRTTIATARFYLKRVLAKTGTHRQAELMRLMGSLPGQFNN
jgi:DNA-binding CsgD family transcriptional regulator/PAS domain-containing protein